MTEQSETFDRDAAPEGVQEYWAVYGGQGSRRIAQNLPSRAVAEKFAADFDYRLRGYPMPYTVVEQQDGPYGALR